MISMPCTARSCPASTTGCHWIISCQSRMVRISTTSTRMFTCPPHPLKHTSIVSSPQLSYSLETRRTIDPSVLTPSNRQSSPRWRTPSRYHSLTSAQLMVCALLLQPTISGLSAQTAFGEHPDPLARRSTSRPTSYRSSSLSPETSLSSWTTAVESMPPQGQALSHCSSSAASSS